jgi:hypothetical protein
MKALALTWTSAGLSLDLLKPPAPKAPVRKATAPKAPAAKPATRRPAVKRAPKPAPVQEPATV